MQTKHSSTSSKCNGTYAIPERLKAKRRSSRLDRDYRMSQRYGLKGAIKGKAQRRRYQAYVRYMTRVNNIVNITDPTEFDIFFKHHSLQALNALTENPNLTWMQVTKLLDLLNYYCWGQVGPETSYERYLTAIILHQPNVLASTLESLSSSDQRAPITLSAIAHHANTGIETKVRLALQLGSLNYSD